MRERIICIVLICICQLDCQGQPSNTEALFEYNQSNLKDFLQRNFRYPKAMLRNCEMPIAVAYFQVSAEGKLTNFSVQKGVSAELAAEMQRVLELTNGYWSPKRVKGKPVASGLYIVPFFLFIRNKLTDLPCDYQKTLEQQMEVLSKLAVPQGATFIQPIVIEAIHSVVSKD